MGPPRRSKRPPKPNYQPDMEPPAKRGKQTESLSLTEQIRTCIRQELPEIVKSVAAEMQQQNPTTSEGESTLPQESEREVTPEPSAADMALSAIIQDQSTSDYGKERSRISISAPLSFGIDGKTKSKIWADEFIELESLMKTNRKDGEQLKMVEKDGVVTFVKSKPSAYKFFNIAQWNTAFHKFVAIYSETRPTDCAKLMKYAVSISTLANQASLPAALAYDRTFREWRESDPDSYPWDQLNTELYQHALGSALQHKFNQTQNTQSKTQSNSTGNFRIKPGTSSNTNDTGYCYQYNNFKGRCNRKPCPFPHICQFCREQHHKGICPRKQQKQAASSQTTEGSGFRITSKLSAKKPTT
ncbi:hypothetical protein FSP39_009429 [Pinctada imbricata]|uniref:C3H1-type domain-containing protein n=1 Tax=Pinctada imbricata TaxID=66713 RepID=A0AA88XXB5_PINIB|nr:hypothetical protein FSP39_009429 [Pinctada imbricata]